MIFLSAFSILFLLVFPGKYVLAYDMPCFAALSPGEKPE
jgi:hypothetical protein